MLQCAELARTQRHSEYYFPDGNIVLLVVESRTLYRMTRSYLSLDSDYWQTLLSLNPENPDEGTTDAQPVLIHAFKGQEFDWFLDYQLRHRVPKDGRRLEALMAILKVAHFFQNEGVLEDAQHGLDQHPTFRPSLRYALGLKVMNAGWVSAAFRELVVLPLDQLTALDVADIELMGLGGYHTLIRARLSIESHRKYLAYTPPRAVHSASCPFNLGCSLAWEREWKSGVARRLLHPEEHIPGAFILEELARVEINDMEDECKEHTLAWTERTGLLMKEEDIATTAIRSLTG
ncbi:hypothetical protein C8Q79DRAFT_1010890 [Trametes meyenii]|nr:hypothetical protein C8Q79DRAFT_1010890 [Trametes meyenii]